MKIISYLLNWSYITCVIIIFCGVTQPPVFVLINPLTHTSPQDREQLLPDRCVLQICRFLSELEYPHGEEMMPGVLGVLGYTACGVLNNVAILIFWVRYEVVSVVSVTSATPRPWHSCGTLCFGRNLIGDAGVGCHLMGFS